jgi:hypothetical protein
MKNVAILYVIVYEWSMNSLAIREHLLWSSEKLCARSLERLKNVFQSRFMSGCFLSQALILTFR